MRPILSCPVRAFLTSILTVLLLIPSIPGVAAESVGASTTIKHKGIDYFVPGKRIRIVASVTDSAGIELVRCYFKAGSEGNYVFIPMTAISNKAYSVTLPAPGTETSSLQYLLLSGNGKGQAVKTKPFIVNSREGADTPLWQSGAQEGSINVSTELPLRRITSQALQIQ